MAGWAGDGKAWVHEMMKNPPTKDEVIALLKFGPMVLEAPGKCEEIQVEIRRDRKTVVDWINGTEKKGGRLGSAHFS